MLVSESTVRYMQNSAELTGSFLQFIMNRETSVVHNMLNRCDVRPRKLGRKVKLNHLILQSGDFKQCIQVTTLHLVCLPKSPQHHLASFQPQNLLILTHIPGIPAL